MEILVQRKHDNHDSTVGHVYMDGELFCVSIEDTFRHNKIKGVTRIPAGRYKVELRKEGGMYGRYLDKHGTDGMLHLQNVPGFTFIYLHIGNTDEDSHGCILVAQEIRQGVTRGQLEQRIVSSTNTYKKLHALVSIELAKGREVWVTVLD